MRTGDLVFGLYGSADNAISAVTSGYKGAPINHVGVLVETSFGWFVLEAFHPEVRLTKFEVFERRHSDLMDSPRLIFGRLKPEFHHLIPKAIRYGIQQRNVPYDRLYLTGESALYCSELVVDMFKHANEASEFFPESPMSFRDTLTGEIHPTWIEYYNYFGMPVPHGEPGSNPGDLSNDPKLEIYRVVGNFLGIAD